MVVNDLDIMGVAILPTEANTPLVIDTDTVLAAPSSSELLQSITRRYSQIGQCLGRVQSDELSQHGSEKICRKTSDWFAIEQAFRGPIGEAFDHL